MRIKIDHIGAGGDGVAMGSDGPIYVPYAVDGDDIEIKFKGKQAHISHIHTPSSYRTTPKCKHFGRCGGCALQHVSPDYYISWKQKQIKLALGHRGFEDITILPPEISKLGSRRRARFSVLGQGKGIALVGFSEKSSHNIVNVTECPVLDPKILALTDDLRKFLGKALAKNQKMAIQVNLADNGLDIVFEMAGEPDLEMRMDSAAFADVQDIARICWLDTRLKKPFNEILCERRKPYVTFDGRQVYIPSGAFLQATKEGEEALSGYVKHALKNVGKIVDIFSGCGTFAIALISDHGVHAVDGNLEMVTALKNSANRMGRIRNLTTEVRDLFLRPLLVHELKNYDGVVIDPPRAGAREQIEEIAKSDIKNIVMISCNPATFARDARRLVDGGFIMGDILPVDQFLYAAHLEVVASFSR
ncbi:MAG: hypothetical protein K9G26_05480 [Emcibacter sp.]|nr:hypothetical protein [Emcibacter sp.]